MDSSDQTPTGMLDLFGPAILKDAAAIHPESVNARAVSEAAGALLRLKGQPDRQRELVLGMARSTAAALCRWVYDPAFWRAVGGIETH